MLCNTGVAIRGGTGVTCPLLPLKAFSVSKMHQNTSFSHKEKIKSPKIFWKGGGAQSQPFPQIFSLVWRGFPPPSASLHPGPGYGTAAQHVV